MIRRTWVAALSGWVAFAVAVGFLAWRLAQPPQKPMVAQPSELEVRVGALELRLSNAQAALQEAQTQFKDTEAQLASALRYLDTAERWAGGLSRWGPMGWLYWRRGFTEIGPPVQDSPWWNYDTVDELVYQMRSILLAVPELRPVKPTEDPILSREVVQEPRLTTPLEGYDWVGVDYREPIELHIAGRRVEAGLILLFLPQTGEECTVYLEGADGVWLKAVLAHDTKPLQRWLKELYENQGPWD